MISSSYNQVHQKTLKTIISNELLIFFISTSDLPFHITKKSTQKSTQGTKYKHPPPQGTKYKYPPPPGTKHKHSPPLGTKYKHYPPFLHTAW